MEPTSSPRPTSSAMSRSMSVVLPELCRPTTATAGLGISIIAVTPSPNAAAWAAVLFRESIALGRKVSIAGTDVPSGRCQAPLVHRCWKGRPWSPPTKVNTLIKSGDPCEPPPFQKPSVAGRRKPPPLRVKASTSSPPSRAMRLPRCTPPPDCRRSSADPPVVQHSPGGHAGHAGSDEHRILALLALTGVVIQRGQGPLAEQQNGHKVDDGP